MEPKTDDQVKRDREQLATLIAQDKAFLAEAQRAVFATQSRLRILSGMLARADANIANEMKA